MPRFLQSSVSSPSVFLKRSNALSWRLFSKRSNVLSLALSSLTFQRFNVLTLFLGAFFPNVPTFQRSSVPLFLSLPFRRLSSYHPLRWSPSDCQISAPARSPPRRLDRN